jgi:hypothetical protein
MPADQQPGWKRKGNAAKTSKVVKEPIPIPV